MDKLRVLLADDDPVFCQLAEELLVQHDYAVFPALNADSTLRTLSRGPMDILMLDLCFPALQDGFRLLEEVRKKYPRLVILMISGSGHAPDVVRAIRQGAADFIEKPIEPEYLIHRLQSLGELLQAERQLRQLEHTAIGMVGVSEEMRKVFDQIIAAAKYDSPVLITGETGVGKELAARAVHRLSKLGSRDLVCINCASVPKDLFEAELFGYAKGAFTGAVNAHKGYFEFAHNTSLFLDEISELPHDVQAKLLRVLSEGEVQTLGGKVSRSNTRVISASNQDLPAAIRAGDFREDLFYRLNAIHISIPPLRQRPADIYPLARHFLLSFCQSHQVLPREISPRAQVWLAEQPWEGNARELKSCVERALIFAGGGDLEPEDFISQPVEPADAGEELGTLRDSLKRYEGHLIREHLKANNYNLTQTARQLGVDKSNLSKRIHSLGIEMHPEGEASPPFR